MNNLFVITGGPGTGKTTLIDALRKRGAICFNEVSREIIAEANLNKTDLLPWKNLRLFANECLTRMEKQLQQAEGKESYFFDRGIPDIVAYLRFGGETSTPYIVDKCRSYAKLAFIAHPWEEIFVNDDERPQSFDDCCQLHKLLESTYKEFGYTVVEIPKISVEGRADFVLRTIKDYSKVNDIEKAQRNS